MAKTSTSVIVAKTLVHAAALAPIALLGWQFWQVWQSGSDAWAPTRWPRSSIAPGCGRCVSC